MTKNLELVKDEFEELDSTIRSYYRLGNDKFNTSPVKRKRDEKIFLFKTPNPQKENGIIEIFNELACNKLSRILSIPTKEVFIGQLDEKRGIFQEAKGNKFLHEVDKAVIKNLLELKELAVFHQFVFYEDDKKEHFIVAEDNTFYPIDYGNALNSHVGDRFNLNSTVEDFTHYYTNKTNIDFGIKGMSELLDTIARIQSLENERIEMIIDDSVNEILNYATGEKERELLFENAKVVKKLLKLRKDAICEIMFNWLEYKRGLHSVA